MSVILAQSQGGGHDEDGSAGVGGGSVNRPGGTDQDKSGGRVDEKAAKALGKMEKQRQRRLARQKQASCEQFIST